MSSQFQDMRAQLESDEQLKILMAGLRGSNLNDSDYAEEGVNMVMVEVRILFMTHALHSSAPLPCCGRAPTVWAARDACYDVRALKSSASVQRARQALLRH